MTLSSIKPSAYEENIVSILNMRENKSPNWHNYLARKWQTI